MVRLGFDGVVSKEWDKNKEQDILYITLEHGEQHIIVLTPAKQKDGEE